MSQSHKEQEAMKYIKNTLYEHINEKKVKNNMQPHKEGGFVNFLSMYAQCFERNGRKH